MRKFTQRMIVFLFVATFFAIAACSEDVVPQLPTEDFEKFDLKMDYTDGEEEDTTAGPRIVSLISPIQLSDMEYVAIRV